MAYKPYKMKGHALPGIKQSDNSPAKATSDRKKFEGVKSTKGSKTTKLDAITKNYGGTWSTEDRSGKGGSNTTFVNEQGQTVKQAAKSQQKSSPAKCPLVAALAPVAAQMIGGMMSKKKEE